MQHRPLGRTGMDVTDIGLGALEIGRPWGLKSAEDPGLPPALEEVDRLLRKALDLGINFIDTAAAYEDSEERIGQTIPDRRDDYYLATKFGEDFKTGVGSDYNFSASRAQWFLERSLKRLKTDYVDLWQIHCGPNELETVTSDETMGAMLRAKEAGKTRFLGVSTGSVEATMAAIRTGVYDTLQLTYNIFDRTMEHEVFPAAQAAGMGVIIKWPLGGGTLTSKYDRLDADQASRKEQSVRLKAVAARHGMSLADMALRFILSQEAVSSIIAGTRRVEHLESNVANSGKSLDRGIIEEIDAAL